MLSLFDDGWTVAVDIAKLKFDRSDEEKNVKIKDKYYENLIHFPLGSAAPRHRHRAGSDYQGGLLLPVHRYPGRWSDVLQLQL